MLLVHENKVNKGKWEVAWMWLPHFLAADRELHRYVDKKMTEKFKGQMVDVGSPSEQALVGKMHQAVMDLVLERYPIRGLRRFLEGYVMLEPDEEVTKP